MSGIQEHGIDMKRFLIGLLMMVGMLPAFGAFYPNIMSTNPPSYFTNKTLPYWLNVKDPPYNAKGDGVTDDTAAFTTAMSVGESQGRPVYAPDGTYIVDTLTFPNYGSNVVIFGNGPLSTILQSKNANSPIFKGGLLTAGKGVSRDNYVGHLAFKAHANGAIGNNGTNCFVDCRNISNSQFADIWLLSNGNSGTNTVGFYLFADDATPINCYYNDFKRIWIDGQGLGTRGPSVVFRIKGTASSHNITDCRIQATAIGGVPYVTEFAEIADYCRGITIAHNKFEGMALLNTSVIYTLSYGTYIDDNYFENTGSAINIQPETETGLQDWTVVTRNQFAANTVENINFGRAIRIGNYAVGSTAPLLAKLVNNFPRLELNGGGTFYSTDPALKISNNKLVSFLDNVDSPAAASFLGIDPTNYFHIGVGNATVYMVNPTTHGTFIGGSGDAGINSLEVNGNLKIDGGSAFNVNPPSLEIKNNGLFSMRDVSGGFGNASFMGVDTANFFHLGVGNATMFMVNPTNKTTFLGGTGDAGTNTLVVNGTLQVGTAPSGGGSILMQNGKFVLIKDTAGTYENVVGIDGANNLVLSSPTVGGGIINNVRKGDQTMRWQFASNTVVTLASNSLAVTVPTTFSQGIIVTGGITNTGDGVHLGGYRLFETNGVNNIFLVGREQLNTTQTNYWPGDDLRSALASDATSTSTTFANLNLTTTLLAGKTYEFTMILFISDSIAADGAKVDLNGGTATMTDFRSQFTSFDSALNLSTQTTALGTAATMSTFTGAGMVEVHGVLTVNAGGTVIPRFAQSGHTTGTLTCFRGSNIIFRQIL